MPYIVKREERKGNLFLGVLKIKRNDVGGTVRPQKSIRKGSGRKKPNDKT